MKKIFSILILSFFTLSIGLVTQSNAEGDSTKGKETFTNTCVTCHGPGGKGDGVVAAALDPKPRDLSDANYVSGLSDEHLKKVIAEGGAAVGKSPTMPASGGALSEQDVWNVIAYIRKDLCKCQSK